MIFKNLVELSEKNLMKKKLNNILINIFKKHGLTYEHAKISSKALINAELVGAHSHGLSRLKMYCDRIKKKIINPNPKIKVRKISQSITHIDANDSIGFVAADLAINTAIRNAKKAGIALVAVKNSGHYGLSGYYVEQAVKKNLIAMCFTNAPPAIAPHGAIKSLFGTNPICFGSPTGSNIPFILDTSVSMINRGKIRVAAKNGKKIPEGVALDKYGNQTTSAEKALKGVQLPIGGFSYSQGIEQAIENNWISDINTAQQWLENQLYFGLILLEQLLSLKVVKFLLLLTKLMKMLQMEQI